MLRYSIIIPVYNGSKFINNCVNSLFNQTYPEIEVVIVDDGSTDNTVETVNEIIKNNPDRRIILSQVPHGGPSAARNRGVELSTGDYICFLDSDDTLDTSLFERLSKLDEDFDVCYYGWNEVTEKGEVLSRYDSSYEFMKGSVSGMEAAKMKYRNQLWICHGNAVYKSGLIKDNGLKYMEKVFSGEDTNFIYKSLMNAGKVICLPGNFLNVTYRENSLMHSSFRVERTTEFLALEDLIDYQRAHFSDAEMDNMLCSLYSYSHAAVAKQIVKAVKVYDYISFKKICKKYIPDFEVNSKMILNRRQKLEIFLYRNFRSAFFFGCKYIYHKKARNINEIKNS